MNNSNDNIIREIDRFQNGTKINKNDLFISFCVILKSIDFSENVILRIIHIIWISSM